MIRFVDALRYRSLRDVQQPLGAFQVLVGPNASGKSNFLDVVVFVGDLLKVGLLEAVRARSPNPRNLVWMESSDRFELAVELRIPDDRRARLANGYEEARYELAIGLDSSGELAILAETLWLKPGREKESVPSRQRSLFPEQRDSRAGLVWQEGRRSPPGWRKVVTKRGGSRKRLLLFGDHRLEQSFPYRSTQGLARQSAGRRRQVPGCDLGEAHLDGGRAETCAAQ